MANNTINTRIILKNDSTTNWTSKDPVLLKGEIGFDLDLNIFKVGDGIKKWSEITTTYSNLQDILSTVNTTLNNYAKLNGASFTGAVTVLAPTADMNPATKKYVDDAVGGITEFEYEVVTTLPTTGKKGTIYLVPDEHGTQDIYDEYIWVGDKFEKIGNTDIDLSDYVKTLSGIANSGVVTNLSKSGNTLTVTSKSLVTSSPTASGSSTQFIDTISQAADGKITATKKTISYNNQTVKVGTSTFGVNDTVNFQAGTDGYLSVAADTTNDKITYSFDATKLGTAIDDKIKALDVTTTSLNQSQTIKTISETDGKISVTTQSILIGIDQVSNLNTTVTNLNNAIDSKEPKIGEDHTISADYISGLATVATSGSYNDLTNKPTNLVTTDGAQNITGEKTFKADITVQDKEISIENTNSSGGYSTIIGSDETRIVSAGTSGGAEGLVSQYKKIIAYKGTYDSGAGSGGTQVLQFNPANSGGNEYTLTLPQKTGTLAIISDIKTYSAGEGLALSTANVFSINQVSTDKLVQGSNTLILDGGSATV